MSFSNPILAGEELIRNAIRSENFVTGVSGWRIARNGDAEFNDIIARGKVVSVGSLYTVTIDNGEISINLNSNPVTGVNINPSQFQFSDSSSSTVQFLDYYADKGIGFRDSGSNGVSYNQVVDSWVRNTDVFGNREVWTAIPGNNGYGGGSYYKLPDGNVILDGGVAGGVAASPIQIGTMPVGYRPRAYTEFMVARGGAFGTNKVTIDAAGVITQWSPDATYNSYLSGIVFSTLA